MNRNIDDIDGFPPFGPAGGLDDLMDILKNINSMLDDWNINNGNRNDLFEKFFGKNPNIKVEGYTKDINGNVTPLDVNSLFGGIFAKGENKPNKTVNSINHEKNILILTNILELCKQRNIMNVFNSPTRDKNKNEEILKQYGYTNKAIYTIVDKYNIDLAKVTNLQKFLYCIKFAMQKKELVL